MTTYENLTRPANTHTVQRFTDPTTWATFGAQWHSGEQKTLQCCAERPETHDVKNFIFRCADFSALSFEPGQFITISPVIGGQTLARCYTLSSSPTRPFAFSITVKRVPGGAVSNWLHDNLKPGDSLQACGPAGSFTAVGHPARKLLYLSAGSGVTPLMSMTRAACDMAGNLDIVFLHSARTPTDIIFHGELTRMQADMQGLRVISVCEGLGDTAQWQQPIGRLDLSLLSQHVPDYQEREIFICGPLGYMEAIKSLLREQDVFTVTLSRSGKTFSMPGNQTVLSAAKKADANVPSSCSQGVFGTCKTALLQGTVEMNHNGGIRQREIGKGLRLLCCSKPTSVLVLDL